MKRLHDHLPLPRRAILTGLFILALAAGLTGCYEVDAPLFYTCSAASPRCPDAMVCVPISGFDSGMLTDWKYERAPAACLPIPKLDKGPKAADSGTKTLDKGVKAADVSAEK